MINAKYFSELRCECFAPALVCIVLGNACGHKEEACGAAAVGRSPDRIPFCHLGTCLFFLFSLVFCLFIFFPHKSTTH